MQVEELMVNVADQSLRVIEDYINFNGRVKPADIRDKIGSLSEDALLDLENIARILGYKVEGNLREFTVQPKGIRIVSEIRRIPDQLLQNLIKKFGNLKNILNASIEDLEQVQGMGKVRASLLYDRLKKYSEYYLYNEPRRMS